mgnify:CR=1 FL=1
MLGVIYKLWPASGFPLAGLVLVVPGNLVMPSVSSASVDSVHGGSAGGGGGPDWAQPGGYSPLNFKLAVKPIGLTLYSSTASWSRAANSASSSSLVPVA